MTEKCWVCEKRNAWEECPDGICFKCIERGVECGVSSGRINPKKECPETCPQRDLWE